MLVTVLVEWLFLKPCSVEMCGILLVMYGSSAFSSVLNDVCEFPCMRDGVVHVGEIFESKQSHVFPAELLFMLCLFELWCDEYYCGCL